MPRALLPGPEIPQRLRIAALLSRALFIGILVLITARVSLPQSERIWSAYETPGDLVRLALGVVFCIWILFHVFGRPKDAEGYRTWLYFCLAAVPFALICLVAVW